MVDRSVVWRWLRVGLITLALGVFGLTLAALLLLLALQANPKFLGGPLEQGIGWGVFPADCPYVKDLPRYVPAVDGWLSERLTRQIESGRLIRAEDILAEMEREARRGDG